jgi:hypothetical protein
MKLRLYVLLCCCLTLCPYSVHGQSLGFKTIKHRNLIQLLFEWEEKCDYSFTAQDDNFSIDFKSQSTLSKDAVEQTLPGRLKLKELIIKDEQTKLNFSYATEKNEKILLKHFRNGSKVIVNLYVKKQVAKPIYILNTVRNENPLNVKIKQKPKGKAKIDHPASTVAKPISEPTVSSFFEFNLPDDAEFSLFERPPYTWLYVKNPTNWNVKAIKSEHIIEVSQHEVGDFSALKFKLTPGNYISLSQADNKVQLFFTTKKKENSFTRSESNDEVSLVFPNTITLPTGSYQVTDPLLQDRLFLIPVSNQQLSNNNQLRYPDFTILASSQGLAIQPHTNKITITADGNILHIKREGGLAGFKDFANETVQSAEKDTPLPIEKSFYVLKNWYPTNNFQDTLQERVNKVIVNNSVQAYLDLARLQVSYGLGAEASMTLNSANQHFPDISTNPQYLGVLAISMLSQQQYKKADEIIQQKILDNNPATPLWRWASNVLNCKHEAKEIIPDNINIDEFPNNIKNRILLSLMKKTLQKKLLNEFMPLYEKLHSSPITSQEKYYSNYLKAWLDYYKDNITEAFAQWKEIGNSFDPRASSRARFVYIVKSLEHQSIDVTKAIDQLEQLKFAWRGDNLEYKIMQKLSRLYLRIKNYIRGFSYMKELISLFPEHRSNQQLTKEMAGIFSKIIFDPQIHPIDALTIYEDYKELSPPGKDGDNVELQAAQLYKSIELFDEAEEILTHLITFRLNGKDKVAAAIELADIYLKEHEWEKALTTLQKVDTKGVPLSLVLQSRQFEAKALLELDRTNEALARLHNQNDEKSKRLKALIYWKNNNWMNASPILESLIEAPENVEDGGNQAKLQSDVLNYAISLANEKEYGKLLGLEKKYGDLMKDGKYYEEFKLVTNTLNPGNINQTQEQMSSFLQSFNKMKEVT